MSFQVRSEETGCRDYASFGEALTAAKKDSSIWKISFAVGKERVRLVRQEIEGIPQWVYESLF